MDFRLDGDQLAMQDAVRALCADRFDLARVADREGVPADRASWRALAELGVLGLLVGGDDEDLGLVEAAVVFEELGRHLASGPVLWSTLAATLVAGVADGDVRLAGVDVGAGSDGPVVVEHGAEADVLIVLRDDRVEACRSADLVGRRWARRSIRSPRWPSWRRRPRGDVVADAAVVPHLRRAGCILSASALVGGAQGALDVARDYALEREQFGAPIGSFQAIKHLLAECYVRVELARAATYAAAAIAAGPGDGDIDRAAGRGQAPRR